MAVGILPSYITGSGGGGSGSVTGTLSGLSDVTISSPVSAQILSYGNDGKWHNTNLSANPEFQVLQAQVLSISTSAFTPLTTTATISANLQGQISSEVMNRQLADQNLQQQINELAAGAHVVFCENMTGDGLSNQFNLTGLVANGEFISGGWKAANVLNTLHSDVTDMAGKPIYDGGLLSIFTRHRIAVDTINITGQVTLDYIPLAAQEFKVWYWYDLQGTDRIDNYYRDDFVASMEETSGDLATNIQVNTVNFAHILSASDNNVQRALETLDDHTHPEIVTLQSNVVTLSASVTTLQSQVVSLSAEILSINGDFVHLTGNESISGSKNFEVTPTVSGGYSVLHSGNAFYEHTQSVASALWTVDHNLNRHPSVTTTNVTGGVINGTVSYINNNTVTIKFTPARTGFAYFN
jgi:hypothetical protein